MATYEFKTFDENKIGRGTVFNVDADQIPEEIWEPEDLEGQTVKINGEEVLVAKVYTLAIARSPEMPYRQSIGIYVE